MTTYLRNTRLAGLAASVTLGALTLTACNSGSDNASSSSTATSTSTSSTTSSATSSTSSTTTSTTTTAPTTSSSSSSTTTGSPSATGPSAALVTSCVNANARSNAAVSQWNSAVRSQRTGDLDRAAQNFTTTAKYLRTLTKAPGDKAFTPLVWKVAGDLDAMAKARKDRKTVSSSAYNADAAKLRSYCTNKIKAAS